LSERRGYRITGTVQGVGFRWWTRKLAQRLGLRGTVRNDRDGSVHVRAEGEATALETFEARLTAGPSGADVRGVENLEPGEEALPTGFDIVR